MLFCSAHWLERFGFTLVHFALCPEQTVSGTHVGGRYSNIGTPVEIQAMEFFPWDK